MSKKTKQEPWVSSETQHQLIELWLSGEANPAKLILSAYKIGLKEGLVSGRKSSKAIAEAFVRLEEKILTLRKEAKP